MDKFIDNIKKGVSIAATEAEKLTKVVADKTGTLVDVTKLNLSLSEIKRKTTALHAKLGEAVFSAHENGEDISDKISDFCSEINELKTEADKLKAEIAALKNAAVCPNCGDQTDKDDDFCAKCGTRLSAKKQTEESVIEVTSCPEE